MTHDRALGIEDVEAFGEVGDLENETIAGIRLEEGVVVAFGGERGGGCRQCVEATGNRHRIDEILRAVTWHVQRRDKSDW